MLERMPTRGERGFVVCCRPLGSVFGLEVVALLWKCLVLVSMTLFAHKYEFTTTQHIHTHHSSTSHGLCQGLTTK